MKVELVNPNGEYRKLLGGIGRVLEESRERVTRGLSSIMLDAYWNIGRYIVEFEQKGDNKAE